MKRLIVNADDLGASSGVNRGIFEAHADGIVTSASLMVDGAAAEEAARELARHPRLSVGLHWVGPADAGADPAAVETAYAGQLARFRELLDRDPTHVDSHHHAHLEDEVFPVFRELVRPLGVPVRGDGRVRYVGGFYAQWEWKVTNLEYVGVPFLRSLLRDEVEDGWTELGCHPGYRSPGFTSVYLEERETEVRTLTDPEIRATLDEAGIELASYRDVPGGALPPS